MPTKKSAEVKARWISNPAVVFIVLFGLTVGMAVALRFLFERVSF